MRRKWRAREIQRASRFTQSAGVMRCGEKRPGDVVITIADEQAEQALTAPADGPGSRLHRDRSEESRFQGKTRHPEETDTNGQLAWVGGRPVDGTANYFAEGKAEFLSMVALVRGDALLGSWTSTSRSRGETAPPWRGAEQGGGASFAGRPLPRLETGRRHADGCGGQWATQQTGYCYHLRVAEALRSPRSGR
jgi:hypothetical protein